MKDSELKEYLKQIGEMKSRNLKKEQKSLLKSYSIYKSIKKNKIFRDKLNQGGEKLIY